MWIVVKVGVCNIDHDRSSGMQCQQWSKSLYTMSIAAKSVYTISIAINVGHTMSTPVEVGVYNVDSGQSLCMQCRLWLKSSYATSTVVEV